MQNTIDPPPAVPDRALLKPPVPVLVKHMLGAVSGFNRLEHFYHSRPQLDGPDEFVDFALEVLGIQYQVHDADIKRTPATGSLVVVANHPFGGAEGLILAKLLRRVRPDIRILANSLLGHFEEMQDLLIAVNPFGGETATLANRNGLRRAIRWVRRGGALLVFPSGTVSHLHLRYARVTDPPWNPNVGRLVMMTKAPVVPICFRGNNGKFFQLAGLVHPKLRTLLLPRQLLNKRGHTIRLDVGSVVPAERITQFEDATELIRYLRFRTYAAGTRSDRIGHTVEGGHREPIIPALPNERLSAEIGALPANQVLVSHNDFDVYYAGARQIPNVLREIGRLREVSFRLCGEGSGKSCDLDAYDDYYRHLFVWDRKAQAIVGAYRFCAVQETVTERGRPGIYTHELFRYRPEFFKRLPPALEMGRSFVQPDYQRHPASLYLLWKGIGHYLVRNSQYKVLLGPVSISNDYPFAARQLIVHYLKSSLQDPELSRLVQARRPFPRVRGDDLNPQSVNPLVSNIETVSNLLEEMNPGCRGLPVLLRHYLKLGGKVLAFSEDPAFSDVLDTLLVVDFRNGEERVLKKYMGKDGAARYLAAKHVNTSGE